MKLGLNNIAVSLLTFESFVHLRVRVVVVTFFSAVVACLPAGRFFVLFVSFVAKSFAVAIEQTPAFC